MYRAEFVCVCARVCVYIKYIYIHSMYLAFILLQQISGLYVNDAYELCETWLFSLHYSVTDKGWAFIVVQLFIWFFRRKNLYVKFFSLSFWLNTSWVVEG